MKKLVVLTVIVALALSSMALVAQSLSLYNTPEETIQKDRSVKRVCARLIREGYTLQQQELHPIYYFMQPIGSHIWGSSVLTFTRTYTGNSLQVDYAKVTVEIRAEVNGGQVLEDGTVDHGTFLGYRVSRITTEEETVY